MDRYIPHLNRFRDPARFGEKIAQIPLRILVEGTRGKTSTVLLLEEQLRKKGYRTLAKVTGHDPMFIWNGNHIPITRNSAVPLLDYDNIPGIIDFDCDAIIVENQAITPYTMRYIHQLIHPTHVLIPNIRIDHTEGLGDTLPEIARNFLKNYRVDTSHKTVYYGENIDGIRKVIAPVFRNFASKNPDLMTFLDTPPHPRYRGIPCIETVNVVCLFMQHTFGDSIDIPHSIERVLGELSIQTSPDSVRYLNLAKVNDPASFLQVLRYIFRNTGDDIALVGYFRKDRAGRNVIFEHIFPYIENLFGDQIKKIWFAGFGTRHSYRKLSPSYRKRTVYNADIADIDSILSFVRENKLVLVTMCNRVNPFMDTLMEKLEGPGIGPPSPGIPQGMRQRQKMPDTVKNLLGKEQ